MGFGGAETSFVVTSGAFRFTESPLSADVVQAGLNYRFR
jgi:hypothetical protein